MNTRLKQFIAAENITQAQVADTINVVRASVSHILAGRNKPSYEFISGLMRHYPDLNMEWLMFGKGKMYKEMKQGQPHAGNSGLFDEFPAEMPDSSDSDDMSPDSTEQEVSDSNSPSVEQNIPVQQPAQKVPGVSLNDIKTLIDTAQRPVNQRKLIKITAFFDDGTFQELTSV